MRTAQRGCGWLLALCAVSIAWSQESALYTYVWSPRTSDVGPPNSPDKDRIVLAGLLRLVKTVDYPVASGDSLDFVIRSHFLVSAQMHNAYSLYLQRVQELNPRLDPLKLTPGMLLKIPSGPQFGGTELRKRGLAPAIQSKLFNALSAQAYELGVPSTQKIQRFSMQSLHSYVAPGKRPAQPADFDAILDRGLVRAIDVAKFPSALLHQMQVLELIPHDAQDRLSLTQIKGADPSHIVEGIFPRSIPAGVNCNNQCVACADMLKVPEGTDLSRARILVEDTGILPGWVATANIIAQSSGGDSNDADPDRHGSFVYSEIAAPDSSGAAHAGPPNEHGIIPKKQVYVAKVWRSDADGVGFRMSDILYGWQTFLDQRANDTTSANTVVVNLSASGKTSTGKDIAPTILNNPRLLVVAAAGNDGNPAAAPLYAFSEFSNGGMPLLVVGALTTAGGPASYSNSDPVSVQMYARGDCVCGAPKQISGTSQAAPLVATAASILASARPTWNSHSVGWRLIATADKSPGLEYGAFGGAVNLATALDRSIVIRTTGAAGQSPVAHHATAVTFDPTFAQSLHEYVLDLPGKPLLRFYNRTMSADGRVCFTAVQFLTYDHRTLCTAINSSISIVENGAPQAVQAGQIEDVILPMPIERDSQTNFPSIKLAQAT
jgi:hypothetical protein